MARRVAASTTGLDGAGVGAGLGVAGLAVAGVPVTGLLLAGAGADALGARGLAAAVLAAAAFGFAAALGLGATVVDLAGVDAALVAGLAAGLAAGAVGALVAGRAGVLAAALLVPAVGAGGAALTGVFLVTIFLPSSAIVSHSPLYHVGIGLVVLRRCHPQAPRRLLSGLSAAWSIAGSANLGRPGSGGFQKGLIHLSPPGLRRHGATSPGVARSVGDAPFSNRR